MSISSLANGRSQAMHLHQTHRLTLGRFSLHLACLTMAPGSLLLHHAQKEGLLPWMTAAWLGQTRQTLMVHAMQRDHTTADRSTPVHCCQVAAHGHL